MVFCYSILNKHNGHENSASCCEEVNSTKEVEFNGKKSQ